MNVLFVCGANVGRSQMAEGLFNEATREHRAISAGTNVHEKEGKRLTELIVATLDGKGIDVSESVRTQLTPALVESVDKVVSFTSEVPDYLASSPKLELWEGFPNAGGHDLEFHNQLRDRLQAQVAQMVTEMEPSQP